MEAMSYYVFVVSLLCLSSVQCKMSFYDSNAKGVVYGMNIYR
jgi:hypothetical protein